MMTWKFRNIKSNISLFLFLFLKKVLYNLYLFIYTKYSITFYFHIKIFKNKYIFLCCYIYSLYIYSLYIERNTGKCHGLIVLDNKTKTKNKS